jgi:hypothetical protein
MGGVVDGTNSQQEVKLFMSKTLAPGVPGIYQQPWRDPDTMLLAEEAAIQHAAAAEQRAEELSARLAEIEAERKRLRGEA